MDKLQSELTDAKEKLQSAHTVISSKAEEQKAQQEASIAIKKELSKEIEALRKELELKREQPPAEEGSNSEEEIIQLNAKLEGCKDALKSADETRLATEAELKKLQERATKKEEELASEIQLLKGQLDEATTANQVAASTSLSRGNDTNDKNEAVEKQDKTTDLEEKMKSLEAELEKRAKSLEVLSNENVSLQGKLQAAEAKIKQASQLMTHDAVVDKGRIDQELLEQEAKIEQEKLAAQRAEAAFLSKQSRQSSSKSLLSTNSTHSTTKPAWATGAMKLKGTLKGDALKSGADIHVQAFKPKPIEDMTPVEREMVLRKHKALKAKKEQEKKMFAQEEPKSND